MKKPLLSLCGSAIWKHGLLIGQFALAAKDLTANSLDPKAR